MKLLSILILGLTFMGQSLNAQTLKDYYGSYSGEQSLEEVDGDIERTLRWRIAIAEVQGETYMVGLFDAKYRIKVDFKDGELIFDNSEKSLTPKIKGSARLEGDKLNIDFTAIVRYSRDESDTRVFAGKGRYTKN